MDDSTRKFIADTDSSDFDGHTEFSRMTPDQRLSWLDEANEVYLQFHGLARVVAEEQAPYKAQG